jgi:hypothetical protein
MDRATNVAARYPAQTKTAKPIGDKFKIIWCDPAKNTKTVVGSFSRGNSSTKKGHVSGIAQQQQQQQPPSNTLQSTLHSDAMDASSTTQDHEIVVHVVEHSDCEVVDVDDSTAPAHSASSPIDDSTCGSDVGSGTDDGDNLIGSGGSEVRYMPTSDAVKAKNLWLCGKAVNPFVMCGTTGQEARPLHCPRRSSTDDTTTTCRLTRNGSKRRWLNALGYSIELPIPHFRCESHRHEFNLLNKSMAPFFDGLRADCAPLLFSHSLLYSAHKIIDVGLANAIIHDLFTSHFNKRQIANVATNLCRCAAHQRQQPVPRTAILSTRFILQLVLFYAQSTQQQRRQRLEQLRRTTGTVLYFAHTHKFASVGVRDNGKWV